MLKTVKRNVKGSLLRWMLILVVGVTAVVIAPYYVDFYARPDPKRLERQKANACSSNLKQIQEAKVEWAIRNSGDAPTEASLLGGDYGLREMPICPSGGAYTVGKTNEQPTCSIAKHNTATGNR